MASVLLQPPSTTKAATKDTLQHRGNLQLLCGTSTGATFVKLFPQVHKGKETFGKDEILVRKTKNIYISHPVLQFQLKPR